MIQTSSFAARMTGKIEMDDLEHDHDFSANVAYGTVKLENILFTKELHRRYTARASHRRRSTPVSSPPASRPNRTVGCATCTPTRSAAASWPRPRRAPTRWSGSPRVARGGLGVGHLLREAQAGGSEQSAGARRRPGRMALGALRSAALRLSDITACGPGPIGVGHDDERSAPQGRGDRRRVRRAPGRQDLAAAPVEVTLVDRRNFHLFQPLTYQVATGALSPGEIGYPLRAIFKRAATSRVVLGEVAGFDLGRAARSAPARRAAARDVELAVRHADRRRRLRLLLLRPRRVAAGRARGEVARERARAPRRASSSAFEAAELEADPERRRGWLTFVVVGAGPTGVEMAGQIGELARDTLQRDFRAIDPRERAASCWSRRPTACSASFPPSLSRKAARVARDSSASRRCSVTRSPGSTPRR